MSREIVFIDGDYDNLLVILRMDPPDPAHYYYFPGEFSFPRIVKWADIEPLRRHTLQMNESQYELVLSRIHYNGLAIWLNPTRHNDGKEERPICVFEKNVHTPYICMAKGVSSTVKKVNRGDGLGWNRKLEWFIAIKYFLLRAHQVSSDQPKGYTNILQEVKLDAIHHKDQRFDTESIKTATHYVVLIGPPSDITAVRPKLEDARTGNITQASLEAFVSGLQTTQAKP